MRRWNAGRADKINSSRRQRHAADPEKRRERDSRLRPTFREKANAARRGEAGKKYNAAARERKRAWYQANKDRIAVETAERLARQRAADPAAFKARAAAAARRRRREDPQRRLNERMSALVNASLKRRGGSKEGRSWRELVPYSIEELRVHLIGTRPADCTWSDYLAGDLEIDHIVPVSAHCFETPADIDFQRCWALSNLRLLPAAENHRKRATLLAPFQPALPLVAPQGSVFAR